ncbi:MAG: Tetratricopeptide 2 repeat protein [Caulobacter sp.]|nr:Tetratricopeptide 2 repeat protein [Caulobacter sp.]
MCRMTALAATVLALSVGGVAHAAKPPAAPAAAPSPAVPGRASAEERAMAQRLDPLARSAFWAHETDVDPRDSVAGVNLSQSLRSMGRYDEAADAAGRVLVLEPNNFDAMMELARARIAQGKGFYGIEWAKKAQEQSPRDWRPVSLLAVAYEQVGRDEDALAAHRQALALAPGEAGAISNLAMYYAGHGDLPQAETLLRRAAALPTANPQVRQNLALVLGLEGRYDEAEKLARQDLPPEAVANNMAWLRAATSGPAANVRSWDSVRGGGGGN